MTTLSAPLPAPALHRRHLGVLTVVVVLVLVLHAFVTYEVAQQMQEAGPDKLSIKRMDAVFVSEVKLSAPPVAAAVVQPPSKAVAPSLGKRRARKVHKPVRVASAPEEPASQPDNTEMIQAAAAAEAASAALEAPASAPVAETASSAPLSAQSASAPQPGPVFVWPKATRVSYKLEGYFRGPFYGTASVEWVRQDSRYQVRLDASVPVLGGISMISEGDIVPEGLSPSRYESVNRLFFKTSKPNVLQFNADDVVLTNGDHVKRLPEMQDPVSQLIQLTYKFIVNPGLLKPGNTVELPMVWSKRSELMAFDVLDEQVLNTPLGEIPTVHVKPRRMVEDKDNLTGEIWFAPSLQYLPIRVYTKRGDTYIDMQMDRAPQQTPGDAPAAARP
jgi:hypothetical protein